VPVEEMIKADSQGIVSRSVRIKADSSWFMRCKL
jgi:hypothetical protein